ncbi:MAG TPA: AraC family transcriptional regulator, partial [Actinomycetes bacterium]|nr:AraC family transcriptional regulator [Actinomycetes bacterium]
TARRKHPCASGSLAGPTGSPRVLGVCNGSRLLAAAGLLDGRRATAHWSAIRGLERRRPQVDWVRGQR